ncbi:hypothetical protein [Schleiferilactobacillus perolens]|jgi:maltodextrin utilization protein YvdJ|uniref:hypothetical protein n=1 Tax=Schleiferilactobacillus perolens TaxID=100468 RepID=UPI002355C214|nr:hypothetical protein [Schleiferilactobacillus perolens]MCI2171620.1 hypothetical protein [Schleiferilactobacillus perolens]
MDFGSVFPFNYLTAIVSPKKTFTHRHDMGWWKMMLIWIVLLMLMIVPIPAYYGRQEQVNMDILLPKTAQAIDSTGAQRGLATAFQSKTSRRVVLYRDRQVIIGQNLSETQAKSRPVSITVQPKYFALLEDKAAFRVPRRTSIPYRSVTQYLNRQWYAQNKSLVTMYFVTLFGGISFVVMLLLWLGLAFLLWLSRFNHASSVRRFKESANLVLNTMGGGAVVACLVGLVHFQFGFSLVILVLWTIIMISIMFWQTRLNDGYVATGRMQTYD